MEYKILILRRYTCFNLENEQFYINIPSSSFTLFPPFVILNAVRGSCEYTAIIVSLSLTFTQVLSNFILNQTMCETGWSGSRLALHKIE